MKCNACKFSNMSNASDSNKCNTIYMFLCVCSGEGSEFWRPWLCQTHPPARPGGGGCRRDWGGPAALHTVSAPEEAAGAGDAAHCQAAEGGGWLLCVFQNHSPVCFSFEEAMNRDILDILKAIKAKDS